MWLNFVSDGNITAWSETFLIKLNNLWRMNWPSNIGLVLKILVCAMTTSVELYTLENIHLFSRKTNKSVDVFFSCQLSILFVSIPAVSSPRFRFLSPSLVSLYHALSLTNISTLILIPFPLRNPLYPGCLFLVISSILPKNAWISSTNWSIKLLLLNSIS